MVREYGQWLFNNLHTSLFGVPLWVISVCGITGVLVDIDHLIAYYWLTGLDGKFLHTPLFFISCLVFFGLSAYLTRLFIQLVLGDKE